MIRYMRSALVPQGKWNEAFQWAMEVTEYINANFPDLKLQVFTNRFGQLNVIHWMVDTESLSALNEYQLKIGADKGYQELVAKTEGLFVTGSLEDKVFLSY